MQRDGLYRSSLPTTPRVATLTHLPLATICLFQDLYFPNTAAVLQQSISEADHVESEVQSAARSPIGLNRTHKQLDTRLDVPFQYQTESPLPLLPNPSEARRLANVASVEKKQLLTAFDRPSSRYHPKTSVE